MEQAAHRRLRRLSLLESFEQPAMIEQVDSSSRETERL
jgi:hypothetical protein